MSSAKTASALESAVHSLALIHYVAGEQSPTDPPLVKEVPAGAQRLLAYQKSKMKPITVMQLEQLVTCKAGPSATLHDFRSVAIRLLAFAAFLRFDELARLDRSDVKIENDILQLFIELSKTDQYRDGAWVVLAASGKVTCPVTRYLEKAELSFASPLFCQLSKTKFAYKKRAKGLVILGSGN